MSIPNTEVETVSESTVPVVPSDWTEATKWLWGLDQREVKLAEWSAIVEWLTSTEFDDRTYLASEVAASLIERRAPASIKNQLVIKKGPPPKCRMTFEARPEAVGQNSTLSPHEGLAQRLERIVNARTGGRVRDLRIELPPDQICITGTVPTYYTKQLVTDAILEEIKGRELTNKIDVE